MVYRCHGQAARILRIDDDGRDLVGISQPQMCPGFAGVRRFVNSVPGRQIRPLETFTAADVNHVGIGFGYRQGSYRAGRLIVKNGHPRITKIGGVPHTAVYGSHIKDIWLAGYTTDRHRATSAERTNTTPAHLVKEAGSKFYGGRWVFATCANILSRCSLSAW